MAEKLNPAALPASLASILAKKIATRLFTMSDGARADRIALMQKIPGSTAELPLGGWGFDPATREIARELESALRDVIASRVSLDKETLRRELLNHGWESVEPGLLSHRLFPRTSVNELGAVALLLTHFTPNVSECELFAALRASVPAAETGAKK